MKLCHLGWAGVETEHDGHTLLLDCFKGSFWLIPGEELAAPQGPGRAVAALVTHLHADHADPVAIAAALAEGALVFRPGPNPGTGDGLIMTAPAEAQFLESGLKPEIVQPWEGHRAGPFRIIATPAVDGFGQNRTPTDHPHEEPARGRPHGPARRGTRGPARDAPAPAR